MSTPKTTRAALVEIKDDPAQTREPDQGEEVRIGYWYWYTNPEGDESDKEGWLGCAVVVGTNFVEIESPHGGCERVHLSDFSKRLRREMDPEGEIGRNITTHKENVERLMGEVKELTGLLGVSPRLGIGMGSEQPKAEGYALSTRTASATDMKDYKAQLVKAKDVDLPALFAEIKGEHKELAIWMTASAIPLRGEVDSMRGCIKGVEDRIFNVSLYAGLTEDVVQVRKGAAADFGEKLALMQRRLYMDEECLLRYEHGGMEFKDIESFDEWLGRPENMERLLPKPRCLVAMRVRRHKKDRQTHTISDVFINFKLGELDKLTFLYIRNGEQLWRLNCDQEFDELIFPSRDELDLTEPQVIKVCRVMRSSKRERASFEITEIAPKRRIDVEHEQWIEQQRQWALWRHENPLKKWAETDGVAVMAKEKRNTISWGGKKEEDEPDWKEIKKAWNRANPYRFASDHWGSGHFGSDPRDGWIPFDPATVYYDEAVSEIAERVQYYNRIALIIQGLYDRSPVLHPHPPVKTWSPEGFVAAIELIYDGSNTLMDGPKPDVEAYIAELRKTLVKGCVTMNQQDTWLERMQAEENARQRARYGYKAHEVGDWWKPDGDEGPGKVARVLDIRNGEASFKWLRERRGKGYCGGAGDLTATTMRFKVEALFNVTAYKPGDYIQFFYDPRTRAEYMQWADLMLTAEEFHAGNRKAQEPPKKGDDIDGPSLAEIVRRIDAHLKRMEADKKINRPRKGREGSSTHKLFYEARATRKGRFCHVRDTLWYVHDSLTKGEAWSYLKWLDGGNNGTWDMLKQLLREEREKQREAEQARLRAKREAREGVESEEVEDEDSPDDESSDESSDEEEVEETSDEEEEPDEPEEDA